LEVTTKVITKKLQPRFFLGGSKMKRLLFLTVAAALLSPCPAGAALIVHEYIPGSGELVTLDTNTGYHWYYDLTHFVNKTYVEQIDKIAGLGTYGNTAGG
jgi:hypothetical protein